MNALFDETVLSPGSDTSQVFFIENTNESPGTAKVEVSGLQETVAGIADSVRVTITNDPDRSQIVYGPASLNEFSKNGYVVLAPIDPHAQKTFQIAMKIDQNLDEKYQLQKLSFNLNTAVDLPKINTFSSPSPKPSAPISQVQQVLGTSSAIVSSTSSPYIALTSPTPVPPSTQKPPIFTSPFGLFLVLALCFMCFLLILRDYLHHRQE